MVVCEVRKLIDKGYAYAYTAHISYVVFTGWPDLVIRQNREVGATPTQSRYYNWRVHC